MATSTVQCVRDACRKRVAIERNRIYCLTPNGSRGRPILLGFLLGEDVDKQVLSYLKPLCAAAVGIVRLSTHRC